MMRRGDNGALPRLGPVSVVREGHVLEIDADRFVRLSVRPSINLISQSPHSIPSPKPTHHLYPLHHT